MPIYYTYLIGWSNTSKFYYGVRYAKNAHPSELFITYFTSSKHVKCYRKKYGNPDIVKIRKTFNDRKDAILWEYKVLNKLNLKENKNFLNATNNPGIPPAKFDRYKNLQKWLSLPYEKRYTKKYIEKRREINRKTAIRMHQEGVFTYNKPEDTTNYKIAAKKRWSDPDFKKRQKSRKWYHNDVLMKSKMLLPEQITPDWKKGRKYY